MKKYLIGKLYFFGKLSFRILNEISENTYELEWTDGGDVMIYKSTTNGLELIGYKS